MSDAINTMIGFAEEDAEAISVKLKNLGLDADVKSISYDSGVNEDETEYLDVSATYCVEDEANTEFELYWTYATSSIDHDEIYMDCDTNELADAGLDRYNEASNVNASRSVAAEASSILAAEEDELDYSEDVVDVDSDLIEDDDGFNDQLDEIADDIDDLKDAVDEIQEDDVNIEIENNIDGHYIAECDRCGGIFISAVSETDQVVDLIHGICPLCDHETDQYLKWVVKSVN